MRELRGRGAFGPEDFGDHSMLHQTLVPSFPCSSASSSSPLFSHANNAATVGGAPPSSPTCLLGSAMPSYANHHSLPPPLPLEAMKSAGFPPEETVEEAAAASLVERDGFSVEDLLDLEEFGEPDTDDAGHEKAEQPTAAVAAALDQPENVKKSPDESQTLSVVTYEPPPPPEMVDLPAHDVEEELEWVSRIMDDSELPPPPQPLAMVAAAAAQRPPLAHHNNHHHRRPYDGAYRTLPPAPGPLRATPTICALSTEATVPVKARRSKRARSSAWSLSGTPRFSDSTSSSSTTTTSSCSSSSGASFSPFFLMDSHAPPFGSPDFDAGYHHYLLPPQPQKKSKHGKGGGGGKKKRGRKPKPKDLPQLAGAAAASAAGAKGERRCSHCGVQKTPQWRAGPEGAKTLCNACGVRYKSGRLLPEYRPACSPTFVSSIHSNSHRKVLEMRRKKEAGLVVTASPAVASF